MLARIHPINDYHPQVFVSTMSRYPILTAEEAAALIQHDQNIGFSGFTPAGAAKAIPKALAARAKSEHEAGRPFQVGVATGASTGDSLDGELARADAIKWRTPYQSNKDMRKAINEGRIHFFDMHLSQVPQYVEYGFLGHFNWAVIEACDVTPDGKIIPTTSVGATPTYCKHADRILIEVNAAHPKAMRGLHDIYHLQKLPRRREIPIYSPSDRIGDDYIAVDPHKIAGIVYTNIPDETAPFAPVDETTNKIGENVAKFLAEEMAMGRIPSEFLPIQSGVGNIANAVLGALSSNEDIPPFTMYSEVIQDSVIAAMKEGAVTFASGTSLTVSTEVQKEVYDNLDFYRSKFLLRPQELSNNPEVARRLGVISINTALETDIFGNVNSTHVLGKNIMNGIGGSGDFTRSAFISVFTCPSVAKGGKISTLVPTCSHIDHSEHSVQILITEQGIADLRAKSPAERARAIVENCAHPDYRETLHQFFDTVKDGQTPQNLARAYKMHEQFAATGDMRGVRFD